MDSKQRDQRHLLKKIDKHFFHPQHSLILENRADGMRCSMCTRIQDSAFVYRCNEYDCRYRICEKCSTMEPNVSYPGHEHKLRFMEKMSEDLEQCDADDCLRKTRNVTDELDRTAHRFIFRCVQCNFNIIHLVCGPMPREVKYKYHIHPLVYAPFLVEDASGEYYCDACETERDANIGFYYCEGCKYYAHVHCLLDEV